MTLHLVVDPDLARLRRRLRDLLALQRRVDAEVLEVRTRIAETEVKIGRRAELAARPPCGTEKGYQWHRYQHTRYGEGVWPLPKSDPCGCRAAHAEANRERKRNRRPAA